jgi:hypothetical protein
MLWGTRPVGDVARETTCGNRPAGKCLLNAPASDEALGTPDGSSVDPRRFPNGIRWRDRRVADLGRVFPKEGDCRGPPMRNMRSWAGGRLPRLGGRERRHSPGAHLHAGEGQGTTVERPGPHNGPRESDPNQLMPTLKNGESDTDSRTNNSGRRLPDEMPHGYAIDHCVMDWRTRRSTHRGEGPLAHTPDKAHTQGMRESLPRGPSCRKNIAPPSGGLRIGKKAHDQPDVMITRCPYVSIDVSADSALFATFRRISSRRRSPAVQCSRSVPPVCMHQNAMAPGRSHSILVPPKSSGRSTCRVRV